MEITLLKQELVIAKTKMLQLETANKDLERKSKVLSETIKIYESDQSQKLREKYFGDSSPPISTSVSSSSSRTPSTASNCLENKTLDRLINYFLDLVQQTHSSLNLSEPNPVLETIPTATPENKPAEPVAPSAKPGPTIQNPPSAENESPSSGTEFLAAETELPAEAGLPAEAELPVEAERPAAEIPPAEVAPGGGIASDESNQVPGSSTEDSSGSNYILDETDITMDEFMDTGDVAAHIIDDEDASLNSIVLTNQ